MARDIERRIGRLEARVGDSDQEDTFLWVEAHHSPDGGEAYTGEEWRVALERGEVVWVIGKGYQHEQHQSTTQETGTGI